MAKSGARARAVTKYERKDSPSFHSSGKKQRSSATRGIPNRHHSKISAVSGKPYPWQLASPYLAFLKFRPWPRLAPIFLTTFTCLTVCRRDSAKTIDRGVIEGEEGILFPKMQRIYYPHARRSALSLSLPRGRSSVLILKRVSPGSTASNVRVTAWHISRQGVMRDGVIATLLV